MIFFFTLIRLGLSDLHIDLKTLQAVSTMLAHYNPIIQVNYITQNTCMYHKMKVTSEANLEMSLFKEYCAA